MSITIYQGDTYLPFPVQFVDEDGNAYSLSGITLRLVLGNVVTGEVKQGTGAWAIDPNTGSGQASYYWSSADVSEAGVYLLDISLISGGKPTHLEPQLLSVQAAP